jgi:D-proline reductase (dithiol) PrdB
MEERGIPTVTLAMEHGVRAARVGFVPFPYNLPMGEPHDRETHRQVALAALALLYDLEQPGEVSISASQHLS